MIANVNWWFWAALFPVYYLYEYIGTKNTIATNRLQATAASNTGVLMYVIGIMGTYICVTDGLINLIPIIAGAWFGSYFSVKAEIKIVKRKKAERACKRRNNNENKLVKNRELVINNAS